MFLGVLKLKCVCVCVLFFNNLRGVVAAPLLMYGVLERFCFGGGVGYGGVEQQVLKSKPVRTEKTPYPGRQPTHSPNKYDHPVQSLNTTKQKIKHSTPVKVSPVKQNENSYRPSPASLDLYHREGIKIPLNPADYFKSVKVTEAELISEEDHKEGKKNYAGAKFSEPPSPSVLPKPPSHWVGDNTQGLSNPSRVLMTVHLKTLLKLQALP